MCKNCCGIESHGCHTCGESHKAWRQTALQAFSAAMLAGGIAAQASDWLRFSPAVAFAWFAAAWLPVALPVLKEAFDSIRKKDFFNEFSLMLIASIGAFAIGEYPEGVAVMLFYSIGEALQDKAVAHARRNISALVDMRPKEATVVRGGNVTDIYVTLRQDCLFENSSDTSRLWGALGLDTEVREDGNAYWTVGAESYRFSLFESLGRAFGYSFKIAGTIFNVLGELLTGNIGLNAMGGPVTTIKLTSQMAVQSFQSFLEIAAYIGVNLAVFNLLPIPALDGSKVVFCLIEWIFKKPVPRHIEAAIHAVGFVLILAFAVLVDILQFARC